MYSFVEKVVHGSKCSHCDELLGDASILGIGVGCASEPLAVMPFNGAEVLITILCQACERLDFLAVTAPLEELLSAVEEEYRRAEKRDDSEKPTTEPPSPLPHWMRDAVMGLACTKCNQWLDNNNIIGLSMYRTDQAHRTDRGVDFAVIIDCHHCRFRQMFPASIGLPLFLKSTDALYWELAQQSGQDDDTPAKEAEDKSQSPAQPRDVVRPSLRRWQPRGPFTESEIIRFLRDLQRTSFRRTTKSFQRWLKRMGIVDEEGE